MPSVVRGIYRSFSNALVPPSSSSPNSVNSGGAIIVLLVCSNFIQAAIGHWLQLEGMKTPELYLNSRVMGNQAFRGSTYATMLVHVYLSIGLLVLMAYQIYSEGGKLHKLVGYGALIGFAINVVFGLPMLVNSKLKSVHRIPVLLPQNVITLISWTTPDPPLMSHMSHHDIFIIFAIIFWLLLFPHSILQMRKGNLKLHKAGMTLVTWIFLIPSAQRWPNLLLTIPAKHFGMERENLLCMAVCLQEIADSLCSVFLAAGVQELFVVHKFPRIGIKYWNVYFSLFSMYSQVYGSRSDGNGAERKLGRGAVQLF